MFKEKYSYKEEEGKIKISIDAFAIGEMLENLLNKLEKLRFK